MQTAEFYESLNAIDCRDRLAFVVENRIEKISKANKCPGCWLLPSNCICALWKSVHCKTKVIVHIHHCEWGVASNTGICIHRTLKDSQFLIRGLPSDEEKLSDIWKNPSFTTCVLWPGDDAVSVEELKSRIGHEKELCLIVPDGTFSGARRMLKRYPHNCLKGDCFADQNLRQDVAAVALSSQSVLEGKKNSFLYPVRKYGGSEEDTGRVSTLEAVAAFMREMGEDPSVSSTLISNMKLQMDRALKQKSKAAIYGTVLS